MFCKERKFLLNHVSKHHEMLSVIDELYFIDSCSYQRAKIVYSNLINTKKQRNIYYEV